eukprot:CAMPEP_0198294990 /NCGR_PEP_ID=MMETSP1449-20131203/25192_1 /TAXON_ID=420275 /ORGANISM="Attheya septentrionalis, Strain CCMP2084" /LENGTH=244 /DNA_ID=CAMNT_0043995125 /DNA_START=126 /DNA_END=860 /DNA_ORIENTATION=+
MILMFKNALATPEETVTSLNMSVPSSFCPSKTFYVLLADVIALALITFFTLNLSTRTEGTVNIVIESKKKKTKSNLVIMESPPKEMLSVSTSGDLDSHASDLTEYDYDHRAFSSCTSPEERIAVAAARGEVDTLKAAIASKESDVNATNEEGETALHFAADRGHSRCVAMLLEAGANPNAADSDGISVLHAAVIGDHVETAKLLMDAGANLDSPDMDGDSPRSCIYHSNCPDLKRMIDSYGIKF